MNQAIKNLQKRALIVEGMRSIVKAAAGRPLTKSQDADFQDYARQYNEVVTEANKASAAEGRALAVRSIDQIVEDAVGNGSQGEAKLVELLEAELKGTGSDSRSSVNPEWSGQMGQPVDWSEYRSVDGVESRSGVVVLPREKRMTNALGLSSQLQGLSFDRWFRGMVTGNWSGAERELSASRAMSVGTNGAGGYLVPAPLATNLIDLARAKSQVMAAGALTVPMTSNTLRIGRMAGDPTAEWKAENAAVTASDLTLEAVDFKAHTLIALVKASVELVEDAQNIEGTIEAALAAALGGALDLAALRGTGLNDQPEGILAQTGVTLTELGAGAGLAPTYSDISLAVQRRQTANHQPNALIAHPRTFGTFDRLVDLQGQPLKPLASYESLVKLPTSKIPVNLVVGGSNDCSEAYIGDFRQLYVGMRTNVTLEVSRVAGDNTDGAFSKLQVWIRAYLRADVQLAHPEAFEVLTGVRP